MSSSSDSSYDNAPGHHETWEDIIEAKSKQISKMEERIQQLEWKNAHLEWHCAAYQQTLGNLHAVEEHEKTLAEFRSMKEPVCLHCKTEELLKKIESLEEKARQSSSQ